MDGGATGPLVIANLESPAATGGPDFTKGMQIAVDEINADGGIDGREVELKTIKTGLKPEEAIAAYRDAASDEDVLAVFTGSSGAVAIAGQVNREKLPIMEVAGRQDLVDPPEVRLRARAGTSSTPGTQSSTGQSRTKARRRSPCLHYEGDYSSGITQAIEDRCAELGCEVTTSETAALDASVDALVPCSTKMKNTGADTYYIETLNPNGPKAARQLGMFDKPIISEQWLSVPALAAATGPDGEDIVFSAQKCVNPDLAAPGDPAIEFCKNYRAAFEEAYPGEPYALFSVYGHDAVSVFAEAAGAVIDAGDDTTRETINAALENMDGTLVTSHGKVDSSPEDHHLTGPFEEGYLLYEMKVDGENVEYVLAPWRRSCRGQALRDSSAGDGGRCLRLQRHQASPGMSDFNGRELPVPLLGSLGRVHLCSRGSQPGGRRQGHWRLQLRHR